MAGGIDRSNLDYIEKLFSQYKTNPQSVHSDWRLFFDGAQWVGGLSPASSSFSKKELGIYNLIKAYREDGHLKSALDPLKIKKTAVEHFELARFDLEEKDKNKKFETFSLIEKSFPTLRDLIAFLEKTYCSSLALHVGGCPPKVRHWFFREFEQSQWALSLEQQKHILKQLARAEAFEKFIHNRFIGAKRFSIEGSDALIPMLDHLASKGSALGIQEMVLGMAHRGRLNVLSNFMNQPDEIILSQFNGEVFSDIDFTGDVKYHIGYSCEKHINSGRIFKVLMGFNSSHLESVNPIMAGVCRARQRKILNTRTRDQVIPLIIHGDASFCGQGVVSETLQLSQLKHFTVGGSLHIILNNQIGFTTEPEDARSSHYASDLAQSIAAPVLLVNGDDVEACVRAMDISLRFRQEFKQDVVIDLISYRRFGHNEGDEPSFTQPLMYEVIKKHPTLMTLYKNQLGLEDFADKEFKKHTDHLQNVLDQVKKRPLCVTEKDLRGPLWPFAPKPGAEELEETTLTGVDEKHFDQVVSALTKEPPSFNLHPKVKRLIEGRKKLIQKNQMDWALAELCAYGTLCLEGSSVRLSGQDSIRGTFSHRHASYFDAKTGESFTPLGGLSKEQAEFIICNAPLSEEAVLGFEYGSACVDHSALTIWEAQFGDFSNGAQIMIDQYISSGEEKWLQSCALTLLLPHGYEGQGPEHSSARLERFLQLCAQKNLQVCYPTTPANLFHVLRRQMKRDFFKPLVLMTPKSLLRHPKVISKKDEFLEGSFQEVIVDSSKKSENVRALILCSGKVYFDLLEKKPENSEDILIARIEQFYPFPKNALAPYLNGLPHLEKVIWLQEEPRNMGAGGFIMPRLRNFLSGELGRGKISLAYAGRDEKASPAAGSQKVHAKEQNQLLEDAIRKAL